MTASKLPAITTKTGKRVYKSLRKDGMSRPSATRIAAAGPKAWAKGGRTSKRGPAK